MVNHDTKNTKSPNFAPEFPNLVYTVVLEIFAGIKYCVSAHFNNIQVIFNNQKEWFYII